jgi:hypothetical protein
MNRDLHGPRRRPATPACQTLSRNDSATQKYLWAALQGFLVGYFLVPCGCFLFLFPFCWRGTFTPAAVAGIMHVIFFSPMQALFLILGAYFAGTHAINVCDRVRRRYRTVSWYEFIIATLQRR